MLHIREEKYNGRPVIIETNKLKPNKRTQVVIVGAGLAGLAAAQRLYEAGISDVIILEAQNRIGGRIYTIDHSDFILELGAQWLHGAQDNPLYSWLSEKDFLDDFEDASLGFEGMFCTEDGTVVNKDLVSKILNLVSESKLSLFKNTFHAKPDECKNVRELFKHLLDEKVSSDEELTRNRSLVYAIFEWFLRFETIENGCDNMKDVSTASYTDYTDVGEGSLLNFRNGYRSLLYWFCEHIPTKRFIYLNQEVKNIEMLNKFQTKEDIWYDSYGGTFNGPLVVRFVNRRKESKLESALDESYIVCDHVIITTSLGFLKKNHKTLFKPALPRVKVDLIESIGFGTVNKIIIQFEKPFWNKDHGFKLVWNNRREQHTNWPLWVFDIIAFDTVRRQPNLLIGWIGGEGSKLMEQESDEFIAETCLRILRTFLPANYNQPTKLLSCIVSRWNTNPFICGSYSYQSVGSFDKKIEKLHEPIYNTDDSTRKLNPSSSKKKPRILFSGEATAMKLYSTTHGAIISGWREADRLKDHLSSQTNLLSSESNLINSSMATNYFAV